MMTKIAIACQGGALHAAFTAGVLRKILAQQEQRNYDIMGLSGTSAGALCAVAAWYGLLTGGPTAAIKTLDAVWADFAAVTPTEQTFNSWLVTTLRLQSPWVAANVQSSPYAPFFPALIDQLRLTGVRKEFVDYSALLEKHIDFSAVKRPVSQPWLLIGAINILSGDFKAFDSKKSEISVDAVRASGAIPAFGSRAVRVSKNLYWDGVYSQNPPVRNFLADPATATDKPDEIWIIQINPKTRSSEPKTVAEIEDRDNELAANLSLEQEKQFIEKVNAWAKAGYLPTDKYKEVPIHTIAMSPELSQTLDFASKLDRSQAFIKKLMVDGEKQAEVFLGEWSMETRE